MVGDFVVGLAVVGLDVVTGRCVGECEVGASEVGLLVVDGARVVGGVGAVDGIQVGTQGCCAMSAHISRGDVVDGLCVVMR